MGNWSPDSREGSSKVMGMYVLHLTETSSQHEKIRMIGTRAICVDTGTNRILASKEIYTGNPKLPLDFCGPC